jgi:hypothetical protein
MCALCALPKLCPQAAIGQPEPEEVVALAAVPLAGPVLPGAGPARKGLQESHRLVLGSVAGPAPGNRSGITAGRGSATLSALASESSETPSRPRQSRRGIKRHGTAGGGSLSAQGRGAACPT